MGRDKCSRGCFRRLPFRLSYSLFVMMCGVALVAAAVSGIKAWSLRRTIMLDGNQVWAAHGLGFSRQGQRLVTTAPSGFAGSFILPSRREEWVLKKEFVFIQVWDLATGRRVAKLPHHFGGGGVLAAFAADSVKLLADDPLMIWESDGSGWKATATMCKNQVYALTADARGNLVVAACKWDAKVVLWDTRKNRQLGVIEHQSCASLAPSGSFLATGGGDGVVRLWDTKTVHTLGQSKAHSKGVRAVAVSPSGTLVASGSNREVMVWTRRGRKILLDRRISDGLMYDGLAWSPDDSALAILEIDRSIQDYGRVRVIDVKSGRERFVVPKVDAYDNAPIGNRHVAFSADGRFLGTKDFAGKLSLWDCESGEAINWPTAASGQEVNCFAFAADCRLLAAATRRGPVNIFTWDETGSIRRIEWSRNMWSWEMLASAVVMIVAGVLLVRRFFCRPKFRRESIDADAGSVRHGDRGICGAENE